MYDMREIDGAIAELENAEPTMQRVQKLAALYVVKNQQDVSPAMQQTEHATMRQMERAAVGGSDFLCAVSNIDINAALGVLDELMALLSATNPRTYAAIMRKLEKLKNE